MRWTHDRFLVFPVRQWPADACDARLAWAPWLLFRPPAVSNKPADQVGTSTWPRRPMRGGAARKRSGERAGTQKSETTSTGARGSGSPPTGRASAHRPKRASERGSRRMGRRAEGPARRRAVGRSGRQIDRPTGPMVYAPTGRQADGLRDDGPTNRHKRLTGRRAAKPTGRRAPGRRTAGRTVAKSQVP